MLVDLVPDLLSRSAATASDRPFVVLDGERTLSYGECDRASDVLAAGLRRHGSGPGDRVGLLFGGRDWTDFVTAYFGVLKAGATAALLPASLPAADVRTLLVRHGIDTVVRGPDTPPPGVPTVSCAELAADAGPAGPAPRPDPTALAEIVFTAGTTGLPKAVGVSHANLLSTQLRTELPQRRVLLNALPLGTTGAQSWLLRVAVNAETMLVLSAFDVDRFCAIASAHAPTWTGLVPAMGHLLVRRRAHERYRIPSVRVLAFMSAPPPVSSIDSLRILFPCASIENLYSSTEAMPVVCRTVFDPDQPDSVGRPVDGGAVRIIGSDGHELAAGALGEVTLRADGVASRRYLDDEPANDQVFGSGWTHTGDLGRLRDGLLYIEGRRVDIVNVGGQNVSAPRVEAALCRHPVVSEAAVCAAAHPVLGEVLAAFVILDGEATSGELREFAASTLATHEVPTVIRRVDDVPRNALGKVVKADLVELLTHGRPAGQDLSAGRVTAVLTDVWAAVLGHPVGLDENFYELGGDSLKALRIVALATDRMGPAAGALVAFGFSTIGEQAKFLSGQSLDGPASVADQPEAAVIEDRQPAS